MKKRLKFLKASVVFFVSIYQRKKITSSQLVIFVLLRRFADALAVLPILL